MAATWKIFSAFLLILLAFERGRAQKCSLSDIGIEQTRTGKVVEGRSEFEVVITNNCSCPQSDVFLRCIEFRSVEPVDPNIFKPVDQKKCLVNNGNPVVQGSPISFKYARLIPYDLPPSQSKINCR